MITFDAKHADSIVLIVKPDRQVTCTLLHGYRQLSTPHSCSSVCVNDPIGFQCLSAMCVCVCVCVCVHEANDPIGFECLSAQYSSLLLAYPMYRLKGIPIH